MHAQRMVKYLKVVRPGPGWRETAAEREIDKETDRETDRSFGKGQGWYRFYMRIPNKKVFTENIRKPLQKRSLPFVGVCKRLPKKRHAHIKKIALAVSTRSKQSYIYTFKK